MFAAKLNAMRKLSSNNELMINCCWKRFGCRRPCMNVNSAAVNTDSAIKQEKGGIFDFDNRGAI